MKVNISLFAGLHDLVGKREVMMELADGSSVDQLRDELGTLYPVVVPYLATLVCAVDDEFVPTDYLLNDGDEVALIPPVSGGSEDLFIVTAEELDPQRLTNAVRTDESGAVTLFYGVARNNNEGRAVLALEYEAHESLAEKKLREVGDEVRKQFDVTGVGVHHRTGRLEVGETSLLVAVASAHRREAFEACQFAVDRIKQTVPIWKKEIWADGSGGEWVAGHPVDAPESANA